ncbi:biosynthetic-type acetolactate synthase large subunit [Halobacillus litoralis]|uniref:Acetolactate synthase n=1 Tax=Halobacillus litoralis TaxID=45668 RepID=A0A845DNL9_9BACI|nr:MULTISPECIES: biosynthetic-type acetolactate synthase large subunit [Halobacillus]MCA1022422.1 biosynthetic-type acetolactate synthase large subunit [Halobacillus litoralis]MYL18529.1 biosynthetic-type acetolactate synthase large subunit [Halobacillus litoralis]MYL30462.1 biosynthetic-type acetolactate synthase large subunit [Halobacillus halophilus]
MKAQASAEQKTAVKTGADLLVEALIGQSVDTLFGYPGGAVLPIYDAIYRAEGSFDHVLPRHEQGAIHAAEGYARVSGRAGVVIGTSGPGATNLVTGIADAMMDSIPLVIFTGQVAKGVIGTDAFQESDIMGITTPITKHNYQVQNIEHLPRIVNEAFHIATTGRPGPVVVDIPKDISSTVFDKDISNDFHLPGYQPTTKPNPMQINKLHEALLTAKKPVVLAGSGVIHAKASEELRTFVRNYELPVTSTLLGLGSYPGSDRLSLGMAGMHGTYAANMALYECDLLINFGSRFDDRLTGNLKHFAPHAKVAHVDIDPAEIGKNVDTHIPIVSDAKAALASLNEKAVQNLEHQDWMMKVEKNKQDFPLWHDQPDADIVPQWLLQKVYEYTKGEAVVTTDVGQHQMWAAQYYQFDEPNRWVTSGGLGTMGYGFPAAIGAQLADRKSTCVAVVGDGGFQMTLQELSVLQERRLPVKVLIVNNQALGMVRQWQEKFYSERYSESIIDVQPDFVKLAESYQVPGYKIETQGQLEEVLPDILNNDQPALIDCRVLQKENVYPMIAPGKGIHEMIGVKR